MHRIEWLTDATVQVDKLTVPIASSLTPHCGKQTGIRRHSNPVLAVKTAFWPLKKLHDDLLVDGFIEIDLGLLIAKYHCEGDVFLEIGCGDMSLRRFVPAGTFYNALDISLSEFQLRRVLPGSDNVNVAIASATDMPIETESVSLIVSSETLTNIPDIHSALAECRRIASPDARFVCSIPNEKCHKYKIKGDNSYCQHKWSYQEFVDLMATYDFRLVEGYQKGFWVRTPAWLSDISYHLPIRCENEDDNVNFFYVFERA